MLFLHPFLLAGAGLIAVPIVLHLIMRRQPRHLEFPALRFIQQRHDSNRRRLRLRHLLLLLLRMAVIALLALALAGPSVRLPNSLGGNQEAPVAAALIFDTAPRMDYRQENRTRLDVAREIGTRLMAQLPRDSQIAVLDTRLGPAVFQPDRGSALQRMNQLETVGNSQPLARVIADGLQLVRENEMPRKEIYIFTDLTRSAWPPGSASHLPERIGETPGVGLYVIDVGVEKPIDFSLGDLRLSAQVVTDRNSLGLETSVSCVGNGGQRTVELYLSDPGIPEQRKAQATCTLKPGESQHLELSAGILGVGTHQGFVRIGGQDGLPADDKRYFTAEVRRAWKVLIAASKTPVSPAFNALYVKQALSPDIWTKEGRSQYDCEVVGLEQLAAKSLAAYAAVLVLDPPPLDPLVWQKLGSYASDGHGVAVFLGRNAQRVEAFNQPAPQELLAGPLLRQAQRRDGTLYLAPHNYAHPVLAVFRDQASNIPWGDFPVFRYWELSKTTRGANTILSFNDDRPAMIERPVGQGRAVTVTTPVSDRPDREPWNLLPIGWPSVILMNQLASYLVGSAEQQLNYTAGQTVNLAMERFPAARPFVLTTPPPQELKVPLSSDPKNNSLTVTATDRPGNYRVQGGGEAAGVDRGFSVNLAPEQTMLERLPKEKLKEAFGPYDFRIARSEEQLDRAVTTGRVGRDLFPLVILLVALAMAFEHLMANRFYRDDPTAAQAAAKKASLVGFRAESEAAVAVGPPPG